MQLGLELGVQLDAQSESSVLSAVNVLRFSGLGASYTQSKHSPLLLKFSQTSEGRPESKVVNRTDQENQGQQKLKNLNRPCSVDLLWTHGKVLIRECFASCTRTLRKAQKTQP